MLASPRRVFRLWRVLSGKLPASIGARGEAFLSDVLRALSSVRSPARLALLVVNSLIQWSLMGVCVWMSMAIAVDRKPASGDSPEYLVGAWCGRGNGRGHLRHARFTPTGVPSVACAERKAAGIHRIAGRGLLERRAPGTLLGAFSGALGSPGCQFTHPMVSDGRLRVDVHGRRRCHHRAGNYHYRADGNSRRRDPSQCPRLRGRAPGSLRIRPAAIRRLQRERVRGQRVLPGG